MTSVEYAGLRVVGDATIQKHANYEIGAKSASRAQARPLDGSSSALKQLLRHLSQPNLPIYCVQSVFRSVVNSHPHLYTQNHILPQIWLVIHERCFVRWGYL